MFLTDKELVPLDNSSRFKQGVSPSVSDLRMKCRTSVELGFKQGVSPSVSDPGRDFFADWCCGRFKQGVSPSVSDQELLLRFGDGIHEFQTGREPQCF